MKCIRNAVLLCAGCLVSTLALAQAPEDPHDHGHGESQFDIGELSPEQHKRIERLFGLIICNCPDENWTLTLNGCPNSCADRQKNMIRRDVKAGLSDDEIFAEQVRISGGNSKVLGRTRAEGLGGFLLYAGPFLLLVGLFVFVIFLLKALTRRILPSEQAAASGSVGSADATAVSDDDRLIGDAIERELVDMD